VRTALLCLALALFPQTVDSQEPPSSRPQVRSWTTGEPGPLPVRVKFFSSQPGNTLDSASVDEAVAAAMQGAGLPPDVVVFRLGEPKTGGRFLLLEVNVYSGGEVRYERRMIDVDGTPLPGCNGEAQWVVSESLPSALLLSHRVRSTVECVKRAFDIAW
jgi:hypothetical protein